MTVYFIQAGSGPVKIGWSANVPRRLVKMQADNHELLTILALVAGDQSVEASFHERFAQHHLRGEWFVAAPEILHEASKHPVPAPPTRKRLPRKKFADLIDRLGGTASVANRLGVADNTVANWRERGISWRWRAQLSLIAGQEGVEVPPDFLKPIPKQPEAAA